MSSHVPFLAVRPDQQYDTGIKARSTNAIPPSQASDSAPPLTPAPPASSYAARIPPALRFPLLAVVSLGLSTLLRSLTAEYSGIRLAAASRSLQEPWQIAAILAWKVGELFIAWVAGYDYEDMAALVLLTNQPFYYLLHAYWSISILPLALNLIIDVVNVALPFAILRPILRAHEPLAPKTQNQMLATDYSILLLTSALAATVYAVTFYLSYFANLGVFLITHFDNMTTMIAHDSTIPQLLQIFAATGFASMVFLFRPTIAASGVHSLRDAKSSRTSSGRPSSSSGSRRGLKKFNPETATLAETLAYNLGYGETGWSHRAEVLAKRVSVVAGSTFINTIVRVFGTVEGTDLGGAVGYAALWAGANILVGIAFGLISNEE